MAEEPLDYQSYLLRLWRAYNHGQAIWRASLESAQTGEHHSFADLESMVAFLEQQTGDRSSHDDRAPATKP